MVAPCVAVPACASDISMLPRRDYAEFRVNSDGEVQGVGLLIAQDPDSHKLMVLAPIPRSPADRAGIQPGDEVQLRSPRCPCLPCVCCILTQLVRLHM